MAWMPRRDNIAHAFWRRWWLNRVLWWRIPFNKPHKVKVMQWDDACVRCVLPFKKRNCNHLRGMHACALATLGEYVAGLFLLTRVNPRQHRLIMSNLKVDYFHQGRGDCTAQVDAADVETTPLLAALTDEQVMMVPMQVSVRDSRQRVVALVCTDWQIKPWRKVKSAKKIK